MYYVPFTGVPLLALYTSLAVDTPENVMTMIMRESKASVHSSVKSDDKEITHYMPYVKTIIILTVIWIYVFSKYV